MTGQRRNQCTASLMRGVLVALFHLLLVTGPADAACALSGTSRTGGNLVRLDDHGDVVLSDGRIGKLRGIRMLKHDGDGTDPLAADIAMVLQPWRGQGQVAVVTALPQDRWGRVPIHLADDGTTAGDDLALQFVRHGFAMVWPMELPPNCRNQYLQAEEAARRRGLGRWTQMQHRVLDAANGSDVALRAGQVSVVQGRVNHVGQTRRATYLNFGAARVGASAELGLASWRDLERQGWTRETLRGKLVRVRGVVAEGRPARVLIGDVSALEILN